MSPNDDSHVEGVRELTVYFADLPKEIQDAISIALFDIGAQGAGKAKRTAPYRTGNLRRSITWSGRDDFPFLSPSEKHTLQEMGNSALSSVTDTVFIGTNVNYAWPMEQKYGYLQETMGHLQDNVIDKAMEKQIGKAIDK